jgi:hypothetical protein
MLSGIHIPHNSLLPVEERELNSLEDYQTAVGGYIEPIDIPDQRLTLIVNESKGAHIPVNARATILGWYLNPSMKGDNVPLGDALLVGALIDAPENKAIPAALATLLLHTGYYRVEARFLKGSSGWRSANKQFGSYFEAAIWALLLKEHRFEVIAVRICTAYARADDATWRRRLRGCDCLTSCE